MYRVEGRRLVGRPRRTWLESVEADVAELEIYIYIVCNHNIFLYVVE